MRDDPSVVSLVQRAVAGDQTAWNCIVRRYAPLVRSLCIRYRLTKSAAEDVSGGVWLKIVDGLAALRAPEALPGWLATVTHRECLRLLRMQSREIPVEDKDIADAVEPPTDVELLAEERRITLREAFALLPERDQNLLSMLFSDPPTPYATISATLGMPIGAIGPTRRRCLNRIRKYPALAALMDDEARNTTAGRDRSGQTAPNTRNNCEPIGA